ncbi:MAG: hypothetical protein FDX12_07080 [Chlorobium sp.]|jgi:hypothetical protein|nr:MAG: hypothetical protein FDX12_07080 [Chlorobium sp.]
MKLSKTSIMQLLGFLEHGMNITKSCKAAGICTKSYYLWLHQGEKDFENDVMSLKRELYEGVPLAIAGHLQRLQYLRKDGRRKDGCWKASATFLARSHPEIWGHHGRKP